MKTTMLAAAALNLATAVNPASALAAEPSSTDRSAVTQTADKRASSQSAAPHYEWQAGYGSKGQWEGHWVLVR